MCFCLRSSAVIIVEDSSVSVLLFMCILFNGFNSVCVKGKPGMIGLLPLPSTNICVEVHAGLPPTKSFYKSTDIQPAKDYILPSI